MQTSKELIITALEGGTPDRVPVSIVSTAWIFNNYGLTLRTVDKDSEKMAKAWLTFNREFDADSVCPMFSPMIIPEYYGSQLKIPDGGFPIITKPAISEPSDLEKLEKFDASSEPRIQAALDCVNTLVETIGSETFIWLVTIGPISTLSRLMEIQLIMENLIENPDFVQRAFRLITDIFKSSLEPFLESGIDAIDFSDPVGSPELVSPRMYRNFFWKYDTEVSKWIQDHGMNAIYHVCGNVLKIIKDMESTTAKGLSIDAPVDLIKAREIVPDATLIGNIDPANVLLNGNTDTVIEASRHAMLMGGSNGKFILAPGCDVPPTSPAENVSAMIYAAKKYGKYPLHT
jgi:uroporphyrinogen decarboxylase